MVSKVHVFVSVLPSGDYWEYLSMVLKGAVHLYKKWLNILHLVQPQPIMSYNWMWGLKKCNNSGRSWMCNRQKLNENQMCNKPNVCGIAQLYHIVQFPCVLGSESTTWALCTASTASLNITQNASTHIWKTVMNSSVFTIQLKRFLLVQRHSGLFVENNHH